MQTNDLQVLAFSDALKGRQLDLIVTGSIGAVESVRLVRALRRLGADVHVWLSKGGAQFIQPMALEWASTHPVRTDFTGLESHLAERDACIVAPASANFIRKLAQGIIDSPTAALASSYLGMKRPVLVMPNMHSSLADAPAVAHNLAQVAEWAHVLHPRVEEGKHKFAEPAELADRIAHILNARDKSVMVAYGGCKAFIDDVRYIANYSTGSLGSLVCEELYRLGFQVHALQGMVQRGTSAASSVTLAETYDDLSKHAKAIAAKGVDAIVFMSSVLDYVPEKTQSGKIRSGQSDLSISLKPTAKILPTLQAKSGVKVGFKLESALEAGSAKEIAAKYFKDNQLSLFVMNALPDVSASEHTAMIFDETLSPVNVRGKRAVALYIVDHICSKLLGDKV